LRIKNANKKAKENDQKQNISFVLNVRNDVSSDIFDINKKYEKQYDGKNTVVCDGQRETNSKHGEAWKENKISIC